MCIFFHISFPNGTVYLPRGTVIVVMALAYANPAGSAVRMGKFIHCCLGRSCMLYFWG